MPRRKGLTVADAALAVSLSEATKVNEPGVRENPDGTITIQFAKRSTQLEGIADTVEQLFKDNTVMNADGIVQLNGKDAHTILGYMEQLRIIADELNGKTK